MRWAKTALLSPLFHWLTMYDVYVLFICMIYIYICHYIFTVLYLLVASILHPEIEKGTSVVWNRPLIHNAKLERNPGLMFVPGSRKHRSCLPSSHQRWQEGKSPNWRFISLGKSSTNGEFSGKPWLPEGTNTGVSRDYDCSSQSLSKS